VGNKADLVEARKISKEIGIQTAQDNKLIEYVDVSAKMGDNVEELFQTITKVMFDRAFK
jgi:50S ribosomal subunit-associated GTPase HflX